MTTTDQFALTRRAPAEVSDDETAIVSTQLWSDVRQRERLKAGCSVAFGGVVVPANLLVDLAAGLDDDPLALFEKYGLDGDQALQVVEHGDFERLVSELREVFRADGTSFRAKTRLLATSFLDHVVEIVTDATAPPNVRADLVKWVAKMGDLEPAPKERAGGAAQAGSTVNLSITLVDPAGNRRPAMLASGAVVDAEQADG